MAEATLDSGRSKSSRRVPIKVSNLPGVFSFYIDGSMVGSFELAHGQTSSSSIHRHRSIVSHVFFLFSVGRLPSFNPAGAGC